MGYLDYEKDDRPYYEDTMNYVIEQPKVEIKHELLNHTPSK